MKGSIFFLACIIFTSVAFGQRVIRKGTRPLQLTPKGAANQPKDEKKQQFIVAQVRGKWQEKGRSESSTHHKLEYNDTLMINIAKDKAEVKEGMSISMTGEVVIEDGDALSVAGDNYTIKSIANGWMILDDGEFLRAMKRVDKFYLETVGKDSILQAIYENPKPIMLSNVAGKWTVYRREAKPGVITKETELVKSISILKDSTSNIATGEIVIYKNDVSEKMKCIITLTNNNMQIVSGKRSWNFDTYLADNNEFVFGKPGEVMHYAKRL